MISEDDLIKTIAEKSNISVADVTEKVDEKELEFSGLISRIGAAYIVGNELGIDLVKPVNKQLKIASIVPNMQKVTFLGKIMRISPVKEFETEDGKGKVLNLTLGDETGTIRMSLWNEKTEVIGEIGIGDVLEVLGGYTKKDYQGSVEVRLSSYGNLRKMKDVEINVSQSGVTEREGYRDVRLDSVSGDEFVHVKAYLVRIFERKMVQNICPSCKSKLADNVCGTHGTVTPEKLLIVAGVIDDGHDNINAVFFRDSAETVLKMSASDVEREIEAKGERYFFESRDVLGDYLNIKGVVRMNKVTGKLELTCHNVKQVNTIAEINTLLSGIKSGVSA